MTVLLMMHDSVQTLNNVAMKSMLCSSQFWTLFTLKCIQYMAAMSSD